MRAPLRLGIAGLGTVGAEVVRQLTDHHEFVTQRAGRPVIITAVSARDPGKDRSITLGGAEWVDIPADLAARDDVDAVVEVMGGQDGPALDLARACLGRGKTLITANKAMLAAHWKELSAMARNAGAPLRYEAAVGGGMPAIKLLREGLAGNRIARIEGILNGTCNYILSQMETQDREFDDVLAEAMARGYAEADPTLDIDGGDAAHKVVILANLAFDSQFTPADVTVTGIRAIRRADIAMAAAQGQVIRLIGCAKNDADSVSLSVGAQRLPLLHPLAAIRGAMNAVSVISEPAGLVTVTGYGAGAAPTASAVLADIIDSARRVS